MFSLAVKTHWKLVFKALKRALKVTLQDINQIRKAAKYRRKISDDLFIKRSLEKERERILYDENN